MNMTTLKENDEELIVLGGNEVSALIVLVISLIGLTGNTTVAVFIRQLPTMNNPFGRLLASQATGEAIMCAGFLFYYFPMMFWNIEWMLGYAGTVGIIKLICYNVCVWSHFFISINRFVAICFPLQYETVFSKRNTWLAIIFCWSAAIGCETLMHYITVFGESCQLFISPVFRAYLFPDNKTCNFISFYVSFGKSLASIIIVGCLDLITLYNVHRTNKIMVSISAAQRQRRQREISFLKQAILQLCVFIVELTTYFIFAAKFLERRWIFWFLTTFAWCSVPTLDGIIILLCNREFRRLISTPFRKLCADGVTLESKENYTATTIPA